MAILLEELLDKKIGEKKNRFRYKPKMITMMMTPKNLILKRKERVNNECFLENLSYDCNMKTNLPFSNEQKIRRIKDYEFFAKEIRKLSTIPSISPLNVIKRRREIRTKPFARRDSNADKRLIQRLKVSGMISRGTSQRPSPTRLGRRAMYSFQQNNSVSNSINFTD